MATAQVLAARMLSLEDDLRAERIGKRAHGAAFAAPPGPHGAALRLRGRPGAWAPGAHAAPGAGAAADAERRERGGLGGRPVDGRRPQVVLQEARYHHLQNCFGYVEESSGAGITGKATWRHGRAGLGGAEVDFVEMEGPMVYIHLHGAFWHLRKEPTLP